MCFSVCKILLIDIGFSFRIFPVPCSILVSFLLEYVHTHCAREIVVLMIIVREKVIDKFIYKCIVFFIYLLDK